MLQGFHRPSTVPEALHMMASLGDDAFFLAGGTELNHKNSPLCPQHLISLAGLDLGGVASSGDGVVIGAMATFQELGDCRALPSVLRRAAFRLVNRNVRNVATVGGQLAAGKSCADLIPALVALEARVLLRTLHGSGAWEVQDYVTCKPTGLIVAVELPLPSPQRGFGLANFTRTHNDLSVLTCAAALHRYDGQVQDPLLAMGGVAATVIRLEAVEQTLAGKPLPARAALEALIAGTVRPIDDLRGSAAFKRQLAASLGADAILDAWNKAGEC